MKNKLVASWTDHRRSRYPVALCLTVSILASTMMPALAESTLFNGPVDRLPVPERVALRDGKVVVSGEDGNFSARVLVNVPSDIVWAVLTDYANFSDFMPGVISSEVLENRDHGKVVEQISRQTVFVFTIQSRIRYSTKETGQQRIDFQMIEGDLNKMEGYWLLEPVAPHPLANPNQILLTYEVKAEPTAGTPRQAFNDVYRAILEDMMVALRKEMQQRSAQG